MTQLFWILVTANLIAINLCQIWGPLWIPYCVLVLGQVYALLWLEGK